MIICLVSIHFADLKLIKVLKEGTENSVTSQTYSKTPFFLTEMNERSVSVSEYYKNIPMIWN